MISEELLVSPHHFKIRQVEAPVLFREIGALKRPVSFIPAISFFIVIIAVVKRQVEGGPVSTLLHTSPFSPGNRGISHTRCMIINHNIPDGNPVFLLFPYTHGVTFYPVVKDAFTDVERQFLLPHVI